MDDPGAPRAILLSRRPITAAPSVAVSAAWECFVNGHPDGHILQSGAWGQLKSRFGWQAEQVGVTDSQGRLAAGASLLYRRLAGVTMAYCPRGPLTEWHDPALTRALLEAIGRQARARGAAFLKIEPDLLDTPANHALLAAYGFRPSHQPIQPRSTIRLDITGSTEELLGRMKSKWRYNIRLAARKGVEIQVGGRAELGQFAALMKTTTERDGFAAHSAAYYAAAYDLFVPERAALLFATYQGQPLAALVVCALGAHAAYLWGASSSQERSRMPNHALQWAAIQWARARGARTYDLWGIPDELGRLAGPLGKPGPGCPVTVDQLPIDLDLLPDGGLWGVYRFKQGFGGQLVRLVGAWDLPYAAPLYAGVTLAAAARRGWPRMGRWLQALRREMRPACPHPSPPGYRLQPVTDPAVWRATLAALPAPHLLQSWEWGEVKAQTGWRAERLALWADGAPDAQPAAAAALQFLWRQPLPLLPLRLGYVPKGPLLDWQNRELAEAALAQIEEHARRRGCILVKIDPDVAEESAADTQLVALLRRRGWRFSFQQIQFKNTAFTSLAEHADAAALLEQMKPKWRYNVRLAERRGITVRAGGVADLLLFYRLYAETGQRDGFTVRPFGYYETAWRTFLAAQADPANPAGAALLLAEHAEEAEPLAGLLLYRYGDRAWYFYGASSERRRRDMPNYLLQWRALEWARQAGCRVYDWWGAPTQPDDPEDGLQGVWHFKQGFGATLRRHVGAWDWPVSLLLYRAYGEGLPLLLRWLRRMAS